MYKLIQLFTLFAFTQAQYVEDPILGDDDPVLVRFETADTGCPSTDNLRNITIRQVKVFARYPACISRIFQRVLLI